MCVCVLSHRAEQFTIHSPTFTGAVWLVVFVLQWLRHRWYLLQMDTVLASGGHTCTIHRREQFTDQRGGWPQWRREL